MSSKFGDLNSVLVEGKLLVAPILDENESCTLSIVNEVYVLDEVIKEEKLEKNTIHILVKGRAGKICNDYLTKGSIVRIKGTLITTIYSSYILANHIEFRQTNNQQGVKQ